MPLTLEPSLERQAPKISRAPHLAERVVFIGGLPGNGKTMLTPILSSFARMEIQKYNYVIEYLCELSLLGRLDADAATAMIRMLTDLDLYNLMMARETNFRLSDQSSVFQNPGMWRYLRRLMEPGNEHAITRLQRERPILQLTTHYLLSISAPLFPALGDRLRVLEVARHPLYMLKQWYAYIGRYGTDVRDFTIWIEHDGREVPFFAHGWERRYLDSNLMDRTIYSIEHLLGMSRRVLAGLSVEERERVLIVPFERFVLDPWPYLRRLESWLGTTMSPRTRRELRRQRVPRTRLAAGAPLPIYKQYGWEPPRQELDERGELAVRRKFAEAEASPEAMRALDRICAEYEVEHLEGVL